VDAKDQPFSNFQYHLYELAYINKIKKGINIIKKINGWLETPKYTKDY